MKKYGALFIFFSLFNLNAQNSTTLYAGGGFAGQENDIHSFTGGGSTLGIFTPFLAKPVFSFGLNLSGEYFFSDKDDYKPEFPAFDLYDATYSTSLDGFSRQGHRLFNVGLGPQFNFNLGERFTVSPIVLFGYSYFTQNQFTVVENVEYMGAGMPVNFTKEIFHQEESETGGFFWSPRVRFAYALSGHFSLWAEADMNFYESKEIQRRLIPFGGPNDAGQYNWGQLLEGSYETSEASTRHTQWGVNIGIAYHFGKRKKKTRDNPDEETSSETDCRKTKISNKNNNRTYFVKKGEFPVFEWENSGENVTGYEVKIYKAKDALNTQKNAIGGNKPIFEKDSGNWIRTNKPIFEKDSGNWIRTNKPIFEEDSGNWIRTNKPIFEKDSGNWIRTNKPFFEKDSPVFSIRTKNKLLKTDRKLQKIFEKIPPNKVQNYIWTVTTFYKDCPSHTSEPGIVRMTQNRIGIDVTQVHCEGFTKDGKAKYIVDYDLEALAGNTNNWTVNSISVFDDGNGNTIQVFPFSPVLNLSPGTIQSQTLNVEIPVGIQNITLEADGNLGTGSGDVSASINLPSCVCKTCEEWEFLSNERINVYPGSTVPVRLNSGLKIPGAAPIKQVRAEIVYIQSKTDNVQCNACTAQSSKMGLISGLPVTSLGTSNVWDRTLVDDDHDGYANSVVWDAKNPVAGVDFNTYWTSVRLGINIPLSTLDCCKNGVKICVRYTFTDIDCNTCDYLVCYDYDPETGNDSGGDEPFDPTDLPDLGGGK